MPSRPWGSLSLRLRDPQGLAGTITYPIVHWRAFYFSIFEYQSIEEKSSLHLVQNTILCAFYFVAYEGKPAPTPAPVHGHDTYTDPTRRLSWVGCSWCMCHVVTTGLSGLRPTVYRFRGSRHSPSKAPIPIPTRRQWGCRVTFSFFEPI